MFMLNLSQFATGPFDSLLRKWMRARVGLNTQIRIAAKGVGRE
jgi:hypothetical protein